MSNDKEMLIDSFLNDDSFSVPVKSIKEDYEQSYNTNDFDSLVNEVLQSRTQNNNPSNEPVTPNPVDTKVEQPTVEPVSVNANVLQEAFDLLTELGINYIPSDQLDNLTPETILEYKKQYEDNMYKQMYDSIFASAANDKTKSIVEAVLYGADIDDLLTIKENHDSITSLSNLDMSDEVALKELLINYYSISLNKDMPQYDILKKNIESMVDKKFEDYSYEADVNTAKAYFIDLNKKQEESIKASLQKKQEDEQLAYQQAVQNADNWNRNFVKIVNTLGWSQDKKQQILKEYQTEYIHNGEKMPLWAVKNQIIGNDPKLFATYLDFMASFDIEKKEFTGSHTAKTQNQIEQNVVSKLAQLAASKKNEKSTTDTNNNKQPSNGNKPKQWSFG